MKLTKKIIALVLAMAVTVTSVNLFGAQTWAEAEQKTDLSGITTDVSIIKDGDGSIINALSGKTKTLNGVTYNNYSRFNGVTVSASSDSLGSATLAVDGNVNSRWETEHGKDPQYLIIDLGNVYSVKNMDIYWEGASAKEYEIQVSVDGNEFEKLSDIRSDYGRRTDDITLSKEINIRAVKIYCKSRTTPYGDSIYEIGIYGTDSQKDVVPVLSGLKVVDYYRYTGKYMLYFNEAGNSTGYNVYIDDNKTPVKTIKKSGEYLTNKELTDLSSGKHKLSVSNIDETGKESAKISTEINIADAKGTYTDIPQVYIYTTGNISTEYHQKADVTVSVVDKDGGEYKDIYDNACNIKIRGNTTAGAPKKPWNIKFSSKKSVLGMDKGKKWCLLANSFDKSLMRNYLSYNMGLENGVTYTSQSRFVEVYINGIFNGNYLMTEPVEAKKERVDIDAYNAESDDILLELGTRNEQGVDHFTTSVLATTFDVNDPEKGDDLTDEQVNVKINRVRQYLNNFETALRQKDYNEILKYMDEDTFVDFYIVNELFKNVDFNFSSTRFYIKDGKIYAGPLWDFDLSSGNCKSSYYGAYYVDGVSYKGYYCQDMSWYNRLLKIDSFVNKLKKRYTDLQYVIQSMYRVDSTEKLSINRLVTDYGNSFMRNYLNKNQLGAGWELTNDDGYSYSGESGWTTWEQPVEFLREWLKNRNIWMCNQWNIDLNKAYDDSKPKPQEPTTEITTEPETTTNAQEPTTKTEADTVVAFEYNGIDQAAGEDMSKYAYKENDYTYMATTGVGTMCGSVTGTTLKHIEWGSSDDYGTMIPVMPASKSNVWSKDAYISYTFSTMECKNMTASIDVGGSKKGPANLIIGYYDNGEFKAITTYTIAKNKKIYNVEFSLPQQLENKESVSIYVKLANTTNIGGNEMTDAAYNTGGELAFNNFVVKKSTENKITEDDISITGYQMSTSLGGVAGKIGLRMIYQIEQKDNSEDIASKGLIIALDEGNISAGDMVLGSDNKYVVNVTSTEEGKSNIKLGNSDTADYYVITMDVDKGYNKSYKIRPYVVLKDGSVVYGATQGYNVFSVAKHIYDNNLMNNEKSHNLLYDNLIKLVDPNYTRVDFNWSKINAET